MLLKLNIPCCTNEYAELPDHAIVEIDKELVRRIRELHRALMSVKADYIKEFDYRLEYMNEDDSEADFRVDVAMLNVSKDDFHWSGGIKHTNDNFETDSIPLKVLDILEAPTTKGLAKLIVSDDEQIKAAAVCRLKEGSYADRPAKKHSGSGRARS